jgi:aminoglycoside phosphotransferase (APT) family kinase protein
MLARLQVEAGSRYARLDSPQFGNYATLVRGIGCEQEYLGWMFNELEAWADSRILEHDEAKNLPQAFAEMAPVMAEWRIGFTHMDLRATHVIVDPETRRVVGLIDFADSRMADPLYDLTCVSIVEAEVLTAALLAGYGDPGPAAQSLIQWYRLLKRMVGANWLRRQGAIDEAHVGGVDGPRIARRLLIKP